MENFKKYIADKCKEKLVGPGNFVKLEGDYKSGRCECEYVYHFGTSRIVLPEEKEDGSGDVYLPHIIYEVNDFDRAKPLPNKDENKTRLVDRDLVRVIDLMIESTVKCLEDGEINDNVETNWYYEDHIIYYSVYTQDGNVMLGSVYYDPQGKFGYHEQRRYDF